MTEPPDATHDELLTAVQDLADLISQSYTAEVAPSDLTAHGDLTMPLYQYDDRIWRGISAGMELLGADFDYLDHAKRLDRAEIHRATPEELRTWFTFVSRGERFCDGFIQGAIDNGSLLAMTRRLQNLVANGSVPAKYR